MVREGQGRVERGSFTLTLSQKPCVKVSPHTALHTQHFVHRHNLGV